MVGEGATAAGSFRARFGEIVGLEARKDALVAELLDRLDTVQGERDVIASDLETERDARRKLYGEVQSLVEGKEMLDKAQFLLVLLDADADRYLFHEKFLQRAEKGGQDAAEELVRRTRKHLSPGLANVENIPVVVKAYANVAGLAQACVKNGKLKHASELNSFVIGFTRRFPLCDFVDVGPGKEEADNKIRNVLRAYVENPLCQYILLGCCHDLGYVPVLREWETPSPVSKRLILIQGGYLRPQIKSLALNKTADMDCLFVCESSATLPSMSPSGGIGPSNISKKRLTSVTEDSPTVPNPKRFGPIVRNASGQRIDRELRVNEQVLETVRQARLCYWLYLREECSGTCGRNHNYKKALKDSEFNALWKLARAGQCWKVTKGKDCDDSKCVYSHYSK